MKKALENVDEKEIKTGPRTLGELREWQSNLENCKKVRAHEDFRSLDYVSYCYLMITAGKAPMTFEDALKTMDSFARRDWELLAHKHNTDNW
jgi:hypothetical protein